MVTSERIRPLTGKTIVREFVEKFVIESDLKIKMLQLEQMRLGEFEILECHDVDLVVRDLKDEKIYSAKVWNTNEEYKPGRIIIGRIHPWGNIHRFAGIVRIKLSDEEVFKRFRFAGPDMVDVMMEQFELSILKEAEDIIINPISTATSMLNKYPGEWVNGICNALGISTKGKKRQKVKLIVETLHSDKLFTIVKKLPKKSIEAIDFILSSGGWMKYLQLSRRFNGEIGYWWVEQPPTSVIGVLRLHSILFVGKMGIKGRMYKIAVIPLELREKLEIAIKNLLKLCDTI